MPNHKPHVVVFFGGEAPSRDLSQATGYWACQFIPRSKYQVTPVHVQEDGKWQVPLGSLPQQGSIDRMLEMLFSSLSAVSPTEGLHRLLQRPVSSFMSVIRGKGGDDGSLHGLGHTIHIPVVGSSLQASQQASNKHLFAQRIEDIASSPISHFFRASTPPADIVRRMHSHFTPPFFIKPASQEGSAGVERVTSTDDLLTAVQRVQSMGDVLVQEHANGTEISITLVEDGHGKIITLPPTIVVPKQSPYYDRIAKRHPGRVQLHTPNQPGNLVIAEAQEIARDIYDRLGLRSFATFDMMADENNICVLEVNTVPTFNEATPLKHQLQTAGHHPTRLLETMIARSLEDGF